MDSRYVPFLDSFEKERQKRPIHRVTCSTGNHNLNYGLFLSVDIKPHRSSNFRLVLTFSTSQTCGEKSPVVKVAVNTYTQLEKRESGAVGDAMLLIASLVDAWTIIVEENEK